MSEINVKEFTIFLHHNVSWMPVTNAQDISPYQIPNTRSEKILFRN